MQAAPLISVLVAVSLGAIAAPSRAEVYAQVFLGQDGTAGRFALPGQPGAAPALRGRAGEGTLDTLSRPELRGVQPAVDGAQARDAKPPAREPPSATLIRHLPNTMQGYRLGGEIGTSEWPIFLTEAQARQKLRFRVAYLSAVSVMPEASKLTVSVNDKVVGETQIRAPSSVASAEFEIPENLVKPGFNAVRLSVQQRHRVDCSLAATYELWTQIDPSQTGFVLPRADAGVASLGDLAALLPDQQGALPIRAVVSAKSSPTTIERIIVAAQTISLLGRFEQPLVDFGPLADGDDGVNLAVGIYADLVKIPGLESIGDVRGPRAMLLPPRGGRRTTIVVTGTSEEQLTQALAQLAVAAEPKGTEAGLRAAAAFPGYRVVGGQRIMLRDLGFSSQEFSGRFFRLAFNIIMPPDFYPADYAKVIIAMAGGYGPGLQTRDAQILVKVGGRNAASIRLPKSTGDVFKQNEIPLPLGLLRPGLNRIEIEALVPSLSDSNCDPMTAIDGARRFLFLDTTEFILPHIARIARMPDLAVTASGGFPYASSGVRPILFIPTPDKETVGAAATIAARMAVSAGAAVDFKFTILPPAKGSGATLLVAPARALDPAMMRNIGLDPDAVRQAWEKRAETPPKPTDELLSQLEALARNRLVLQRNFPAACNLPKPPGGFVQASKPALRGPLPAPPSGRGGAPGSGDQGLLQEWNENVRQKNVWLSGVMESINGARDWFRTKAGDVQGWFSGKFDNTPPPSPLTSQSSLLLVQSILGGTSDDIWTVVTAPNAGILAESVACLVDPRVWTQVSGRISALDGSEGAVTSSPSATARFIATQPLLLRNVRLIAAGWLSNNTGVFVLLGLSSALVLSGATTWLIRSLGRRPQ